MNVREDFQHSSIENFTETYGSISNEAAARAFNKHWIETRVSDKEKKKTKELLKKKIKKKKRDKGKKRKEKEPISGNQEPQAEIPGKQTSFSNIPKIDQIGTLVQKVVGASGGD